MTAALAHVRIGIDLGGTKIEVVALDGAGAERLRRRVATPAHDYAAILDAVAALVDEAERALGACSGIRIGIGTPGSLSPASGLLRNSNTAALNGAPLAADLAQRLQREVRLANDANCFALAEARDGAGRDARCVFGVILGTGVGGGIVIDGGVLVGANAIAGEWGHNPLPWPRDDERPGDACYCGRYGCIETWLSGPGLVRDYARLGGQASDAAAVAARAEQGDPRAETTLRRYEERLARALAAVINLLDPDVIVLGGGLSNVARLYRTVPALWREYVFSDVVGTRLAPPHHGDSSGVRGAAWLWP